jgi:hypothetical protein
MLGQGRTAEVLEKLPKESLDRIFAEGGPKTAEEFLERIAEVVPKTPSKAEKIVDLLAPERGRHRSFRLTTESLPPTPAEASEAGRTAGTLEKVGKTSLHTARTGALFALLNRFEKGTLTKEDWVKVFPGVPFTSFNLGQLFGVPENEMFVKLSPIKGLGWETVTGTVELGELALADLATRKGIEMGVKLFGGRPELGRKLSSIAGRSLGAAFAAYGGYQGGGAIEADWVDVYRGFAAELAKGTLVAGPLGTVSAGVGYVGGIANQIPKFQDKVFDDIDARREMWENQNRAAGIRLASRGWISSLPAGTPRGKIREMFPNASEQELSSLAVLGRIGMDHPLGRHIPEMEKKRLMGVIPFYESAGEKSLPGILSITNTSFKRVTHTPQEQLEFLDTRLPNWRYLLSQKEEREKFRTTLPDVYDSQTVQEYVRRLDAGEVVPINIVEVYLRNPEYAGVQPRPPLRPGDFSSLWGWLTQTDEGARSSSYVRPGEFWQKTGLRPDLTVFPEIIKAREELIKLKEEMAREGKS